MPMGALHIDFNALLRYFDVSSQSMHLFQSMHLHRSQRHILHFGTQRSIIGGLRHI